MIAIKEIPELTKKEIFDYYIAPYIFVFICIGLGFIIGYLTRGWN